MAGFDIVSILDRAASVASKVIQIGAQINNAADISARYRGFQSAEIQGFAGLQLSEAKAIAQAAITTKYSRKNLWLLEIRGSDEAVNLFAVDIDYNMATIRSDKRMVGGITLDTVTGLDPVELRITCHDDVQGSIKKWFLRAIEKTASRDGTVALPAQYALDIRIVHGSVLNKDGAFRYEKKFRPTSIETSLSRRDQGLEELQLSFTEIETQF